MMIGTAVFPGQSGKLNRSKLADMGRSRTKYNKEFKMMAINLCYTGKTATQVALNLKIRPELVS
jgi:transposase-like protein